LPHFFAGFSRYLPKIFNTVKNIRRSVAGQYKVCGFFGNSRFSLSPFIAVYRCRGTRLKIAQKALLIGILIHLKVLKVLKNLNPDQP
jgi:hypothetical protein